MNKGDMLNAMLLEATNAHAGQKDKGQKPYILHPLRVMYYLDSEDEELQCIALGHDIIEDTETTYERLFDIGMTQRVVSGIQALTKQPGQTYDEYRAQLFANRDAMVVKIADLRDNTDITRLKGVSEKDMQRMSRYMRLFHELQQKLKT